MTVATQATAGNKVSVSFWQQVLSDIGAPASAQNISLLAKWSTFENTVASWNPLASEQNRVPGSVASTGVNGAPLVKNYVSQQAGAAETAGELQAIAPKVVYDLQNNVPVSSWGATEVGEISHWGTHGFANFIAGHNNIPTANLLAATSTQTDTGAAQQTALALGCQSFSSYSASNPSIVPGAQVFGWILQPCVLKRMGLLVAGGLLIIFGLKYLGKDTTGGLSKVFVGGGRSAPSSPPRAEPKPPELGPPGAPDPPEYRQPAPPKVPNPPHTAPPPAP